MRTIPLGTSGLQVPAIAVGCMRLNQFTPKEAEPFIRGAIEAGATFFDHADIYGRGTCEEIFSAALSMTATQRESLIIQSKCGIRPGIAYDFSKEHILTSVDGILKRLNTDYLDVLLLHRPDALVEPEDVAEAFSTLKAAGKVRHFGVSNQNPMQIQLLQSVLDMPLVANQLQLSITNANMIAQGIHVNMLDDEAQNRDGGVLDFCRLHKITIQAWSPFQYGFFEGPYLGNEKFPALNAIIQELSEKYQVPPEGIVMAWILRHPAKIQPVTGTMQLSRLKACLAGAAVTLTREEWYRLYLAAGHTLP